MYGDAIGIGRSLFWPDPKLQIKLIEHCMHISGRRVFRNMWVEHMTPLKWWGSSDWRKTLSRPSDCQCQGHVICYCTSYTMCIKLVYRPFHKKAIHRDRFVCLLVCLAVRPENLMLTITLPFLKFLFFSNYISFDNTNTMMPNSLGQGHTFIWHTFLPFS